MKSTEIKLKKKSEAILRTLRENTGGRLLLKEEVVLLSYLLNSTAFLVLAVREIEKFKEMLNTSSTSGYEVIYGASALKNLYFDDESISTGIAVCSRCNETDTVLIYIPKTHIISEVRNGK